MNVTIEWSASGTITIDAAAFARADARANEGFGQDLNILIYQNVQDYFELDSVKLVALTLDGEEDEPLNGAERQELEQAREMIAAIRTHNHRLNELEVPPTGDDYNDLLGIVGSV